MAARRPEPDRSDIEAEIERRFDDLPPRMQQAARYVVDNPGDVALSSMRTLARRAGVDPSTMVRLAQEFGLAGFQELQDLYKARLLSGAWTGRARRLQRRASASRADQLVREVLEQDRENLDSTFSPETVAALDVAKSMIGEARSVFVAGLRSLFPVAFYFHYVCRLFERKTVLLTGTGGTFADDLRFTQPGDVVLVLSYRPYARDAIRAVEYGRSQGAKVIAITDSRVASIARAADLVIVVANASTSLLPTVTPFFAVAQALATLMVSDGGGRALRQIKRTEEQLASFRIYGERPPRAVSDG